MVVGWEGEMANETYCLENERNVNGLWEIIGEEYDIWIEGRALVFDFGTESNVHVSPRPFGVYPSVYESCQYLDSHRRVKGTKNDGVGTSTPACCPEYLRRCLEVSPTETSVWWFVHYLFFPLNVNVSAVREILNGSDGVVFCEKIYGGHDYHAYHTYADGYRRQHRHRLSSRTRSAVCFAYAQ